MSQVHSVTHVPVHSPLSGLVFLVRARQRTVFSGSRCGRNRPQRFSLACLDFSFLFRGVQRGYFSFQRERSEIMKADGLLISAEELPWRNPISACRSRLNE